MRIAVISAPARPGVPGYVESLARGMESQGHRVDIIDSRTGDGRLLPGYEYIAVAPARGRPWPASWPLWKKRACTSTGANLSKAPPRPKPWGNRLVPNHG